MGRVFYVYIMASKSRVIYVGITNDLARRFGEHKEKSGRGFTAQYNAGRLLWFEEHGTPGSAIEREKQIKAWRREKKVELIEWKNERWDDLDEMLK